MEKWIGLTRVQGNSETIVNAKNIAYVEENPDGTSTVVFNYGGGFAVKQSLESIVDDIKSNVRIP